MIKTDSIIRVLLADDHRVLLGSLKALLEHHGFEIVGEATTGEQALAVAAKVHPQVIVMDLEMPGTGGLAAAHRMKQVAPTAKVLILSAHDDEADVLEALNDAGVAGYLVKSDAPEELVTAVRTVASGKRYLSPAVAPIVLSRLKNPRQRGAGSATRSPCASAKSCDCSPMAPPVKTSRRASASAPKPRKLIAKISKTSSICVRPPNWCVMRSSTELSKPTEYLLTMRPARLSGGDFSFTLHNAS